MNDNDVDDIYKLAFENLAGAIVICSLDGSKLYANKAALQLYGLTYEELSIGVKGLFEIVHSDDPYVKKMNELIEGKIDSFIETKVTRLTKTDRWFKNEVSRAATPNGEVYIIANITDVTELIEYKNGLETKVDELSKMNDLMIDRELAMVELKKKLKSPEK